MGKRVTVYGQLDEYITLFLEHLRAENKRPGTLRFYSDLPRIVREMGNPAVAGLEREAVQAWLLERNRRAAERQEAGGSGGGAGADWRRLRPFLRWLHAEGYLALDVTAGFAVREEAPIIESLSDGEIRLLLGAIRRATYRMRDEALIRLWLDTGLRPAEMGALELRDVDPAGRSLMVRRSKTGNPRLLPVGERALLALRAYLSIERPRLLHDRLSSRLWLARDGRALGAGGLSDVVYEAGLAAGLERRVYPYLLRHTFARLYLVQNALNLETASFSLPRLMGHSNMQMTLRYINFFEAEIRRFHGAAAPGDRF
jgi:site-specific recombinase XerD